jgi:hypothetical protein
MTENGISPRSFSLTYSSTLPSGSRSEQHWDGLMPNTRTGQRCAAAKNVIRGIANMQVTGTPLISGTALSTISPTAKPQNHILRPFNNRNRFL